MCGHLSAVFVCAERNAMAGDYTKEDWKKLRTKIAKRSGEQLTPPQITHRLSTGLTLLDANLGCTLAPNGAHEWGLPAGRMALIHGAQASLKSQLLYKLCAQVQRKGGVAFISNPENSWSEEQFLLHGGSLDETQLLYNRPENIEECLASWTDVLVDMAKIDVPVLFGLDTIAALCTEKEEAKKIGEAGLAMGVAGKLAQWFRSCKYLKRPQGEFYLVFLQQQRDAVGQISYGPAQDRVPGGRALKFWVSAQIEMAVESRSNAKLAEGLSDEEAKRPESGKLIRFKLLKNRFRPDKRTFVCPMSYTKGWMDAQSCFHYLKLAGFLATRGPRIVFQDRSKFYREWLRTLEEEPDLAAAVKDMARQAYIQENFEFGDDDDDEDEG